MGRARKIQVQQALPLPAPKTWGGKRKGAGRPPKGKRSSERHKTRPPVLGSQPVHIICRVARDVGSLRKRCMFGALRWATIAVAKHEDFRIVHVSVQGTHLHLIVEAENRTALSRGMKAFLISAAKQINGAIFERTGVRRRGQVFTDRFHMRILKTPREVRNAIAYVLNNWRRHEEDRAKHAWAHLDSRGPRSRAGLMPRCRASSLDAISPPSVRARRSRPRRCSGRSSRCRRGFRVLAIANGRRMPFYWRERL